MSHGLVVSDGLVVSHEVDHASDDKQFTNSKATIKHNRFMTVASCPVMTPNGERLKEHN